MGLRRLIGLWKAEREHRKVHREEIGRRRVQGWKILQTGSWVEQWHIKNKNVCGDWLTLLSSQYSAICDVFYWSVWTQPDFGRFLNRQLSAEIFWRLKLKARRPVGICSQVPDPTMTGWLKAGGDSSKRKLNQEGRWLVGDTQASIVTGNTIAEVGKSWGSVGTGVKNLMWFGGQRRGFRASWKCRFWSHSDSGEMSVCEKGKRGHTMIYQKGGEETKKHTRCWEEVFKEERTRASADAHLGSYRPERDLGADGLLPFHGALFSVTLSSVLVDMCPCALLTCTPLPFYP